jgi:hypothetical protein
VPGGNETAVAAGIRWSHIWVFYDADPEIHRARVRDIGLDVPAHVFEQLFHEPYADPIFATVVHSIDWAGVIWREVELPGVALKVVLPGSSMDWDG